MMKSLTRVLLGTSPLLTTVHAFPAETAAGPAPIPESFWVVAIKDAFPARNPVNATNWYGTSLYGWD
jgi:hypothetical protein